MAKCYKKPRDIKQYQQDVICQMTARHYVTLFNQQLYLAGVIQILNNTLVCKFEFNQIYNVFSFMRFILSTLRHIARFALLFKEDVAIYGLTKQKFFWSPIGNMSIIITVTWS